jgi:MoaA/NifB/PqqE/SkfB family radical SAM enzyme
MPERTAERTRITLPVTICSDGTEVTATAVNLSTGGACIVTSAKLPGGQAVTLVPLLPSRYRGLVSPASSLPLQAWVVWRGSSADPRHAFRYGVRFQASSDLVAEILEVDRTLLADRTRRASHPRTALPAVPLASPVLEGLKPAALSVDVTNRCNLRCAHCFWTNYNNQLPPTANANILEHVRATIERFPSITNILWYGGEPLFDSETTRVVLEGSRLSRNNLLVTNGTFPIPDVGEHVTVAVSLDGCAGVHDRIRGAGVYDKAKRNALDAIHRGIAVDVLYTINAWNLDSIPLFLEEWAEAGLTGVAFTMYTPLSGKPAELELSDADRVRAVSVLTEMKRKYGDLLFSTPTMIELLHPKYDREMAESCPMNVLNTRSRNCSLHLCNDGTVRVPCAIGQEADHLRCRSITKVALYAGMVLHDRPSYLALMRMYLTRSNHKKHEQGRVRSKAASIAAEPLEHAGTPPDPDSSHSPG